MDGHCLQHGDEEVRAVASESMEKEVEVDEGVVMQLVSTVFIWRAVRGPCTPPTTRGWSLP